MKRRQHDFEIDADPEALFQYYISEQYPRDLAQRLDRVSTIEISEHTIRDDSKLHHALRFTAPTELPRFLRKFEGKAPDEVHWDEISIVDPLNYKVVYDIVIDAPDHWHDYYENEGVIQFQPYPDGKRTKVVQWLEYHLDAPRGMGLFIGGALKKEVDAVLAAKAAAFEDHFQA